jgi:hypothetical protein
VFVAKSDVERVRTKEFSADDAGKRVGWVSLSERETVPGKSFCFVDVVTATVGEGGAWEGYIEVNDKKSEPNRYPDTAGFIAVSGISAILSSRANGGALIPEEEALTYYPDNKGKSSIISKGAGRHFPEEIIKKWVDCPERVLDLLKEGLTSHGLDDKYAMLYYWLNGTIARTNRGSTIDPVFGQYNASDLLIPDKTMAEQTQEQMSHTQGVVDALSQSIDNDKMMKKRLTIFSDITEAQVPEVYSGSRLTANELERKIGGHVSKMLVKRLVYLPIGFRPDGRTWPYMDASAENDGAFGQQLADLKRGNVDFANHELDLEIKELIARLEYATQGNNRFQEIATAEKN